MKEDTKTFKKWQAALQKAVREVAKTNTLSLTCLFVRILRDNARIYTICTHCRVLNTDKNSAQYGLLFPANSLSKAKKIVKGAYQIVRKKKYRERYKEMSGRDPFICRYCGQYLELWKIWHPKYGNIYDEYENLKSGKYGTVQEEDIGGRGHTVRAATNGIQLPLFQVPA